MPPLRLRTNPLLVTGVLVRRATREDAEQVTDLIADTPGSLPDILGSREVSLDVAFPNEGAHRFYVREGFVSLPGRRHPRARGLPAGRSMRMERRASG